MTTNRRLKLTSSSFVSSTGGHQDRRSMEMFHCVNSCGQRTTMNTLASSAQNTLVHLYAANSRALARAHTGTCPRTCTETAHANHAHSHQRTHANAQARIIYLNHFHADGLYLHARMYGSPCAQRQHATYNMIAEMPAACCYSNIIYAQNSRA